MSKAAEECDPTAVAARKRARSGSSEKDIVCEDPVQLPKKSSKSDVTTNSCTIDRVALLDAGAQYGKVIDRRVRELNVECMLLPLNTPLSTLRDKGVRGIIISGSHNGVNEEKLSYDRTIFSSGLPILGICYGFHLINKHFGGTISRARVREDGQFTIDIIKPECPLFNGLGPEHEDVLLTHGDEVERLAVELEVLAMSNSTIAAFQHKNLPIYGFQFHPEVDLTVNGRHMIHNFLYEVVGCSGQFTLDSRENSCIEYIQKKVGSYKVLSLVSGGVDSAVCTALLNAALGPKNVVVVHIDNGFMRKDESKSVMKSLEGLGLKPYMVNAALRFFTSITCITTFNEEGVPQHHMTAPLQCVVNPEEKRKIIGDTFVKVADETLYELQLDSKEVYLAQGTLRPDLIESASLMASEEATVIKTHHNDSDLVRELREQGRVVEPLAEFHKDEVRALGTSLGLPESIVNRHPFPGPGLAIRVICQSEPYISEDFMPTNRTLELICTLSEYAKTAGHEVDEILQSLSLKEKEVLLRLSADESISATALPVRSVGVQGDGRTYSYAAALSSNSTDLDWADIMILAKIIPKICHTINRVVWIFGPAVTGPVEEITPTYLTRCVLATLRECDHLAHQVLINHNAVNLLSQMPIVLLPLHFDRDSQQQPYVPSCQRSVVIRTFITSDFMTGIPATPGKEMPVQVLQEIVEALGTVSGISRVLYDLTPKPPGTTEWE